jgi:hypothetical protein
MTLQQRLIDYFDEEYDDYPIASFTQALTCVEWLKAQGSSYKDFARFAQVSGSGFSQWRLQRWEVDTTTTQKKIIRALNQPFGDELGEVT